MVIRSSVAAVLFWIFSMVFDMDLGVPMENERFDTVSSDEVEE